MGNWGSSTADESKPNFTYLTVPGRGNTAPLSANVIATERGWELNHPWGRETLVAIGGLDTNLGIANLVLLDVIPPSTLPNVAAQTISVRAIYNEAVTVTGNPTVVAISSVANPANVTLTYSAGLSDLQTGKVVFTNNNVSLGQANAVGKTFTVNSTSVLAGFAGIKDAKTANAVANAIPATLSAVVNVAQERPVHTLTQPVGTPANTADQILSFVLGFNQALTVAGLPTIVAISANSQLHANVVLTLNTAASNTAQGNLVFQSANQSFADLTANLVYTVNSTSVLVGFAGITGPGGNTVANTIAVANTQQVTAS